MCEFPLMMVKGAGYRRLWGKVKVLEPLEPYANPRTIPYPGNLLSSCKWDSYLSNCGVVILKHL